MRRLRERLTYANVMSTIAVFGVLAGGTAYAVTEIDANSVRSRHIVNGQVRAADLADDTTPYALTGLDIKNDSMGGHDIIADDVTGADINEATLGQVPSALLGGFGRSFGGSSCNPNNTTFVDCGFVTLNLPSQARVLLIARVNSFQPQGGSAVGDCRLVTSLGVVPNTTVGEGTSDVGFPLTAVTAVVGPGSVDFGVECNQLTGDIHYGEIQLSAVALAPN